MRCISGAANNKRCSNLAVDGFDYCAGCGNFLGSYFMQLPPDHPEREKMKAERLADKNSSQDN